MLIFKQQKLGFFSPILQIDWATIYKDVTSHENNWISLYLSNSHPNCKVTVTSKCRRFSCILLCLHEIPCMEKNPTGCGAVRVTAICSFPWQDGKYSWHLLYPRMREWLKSLTIPTSTSPSCFITYSAGCRCLLTLLVWRLFFSFNLSNILVGGSLHSFNNKTHMQSVDK